MSGEKDRFYSTKVVQIVVKWHWKSKLFFRLSWSLKHSWGARDTPKFEPYSGSHSANPSWEHSVHVALEFRVGPTQSPLSWNSYFWWGGVHNIQIYHVAPGIRQGDVTESDGLGRRVYWRLCGQDFSLSSWHLGCDWKDEKQLPGEDPGLRDVMHREQLIQNPKVEMNLVGTTVVGGQVAGSELGEVDGASSIGPCRPEQRIWLSFYRRRETLEWLGEWHDLIHVCKRSLRLLCGTELLGGQEWKKGYE